MTYWNKVTKSQISTELGENHKTVTLVNSIQPSFLRTAIVLALHHAPNFNPYS